MDYCCNSSNNNQQQQQKEEKNKLTTIKILYYHTLQGLHWLGLAFGGKKSWHREVDHRVDHVDQRMQERALLVTRQTPQEVGLGFEIIAWTKCNPSLADGLSGAHQHVLQEGTNLICLHWFLLIFAATFQASPHQSGEQNNCKRGGFLPGLITEYKSIEWTVAISVLTVYLSSEYYT